MTARANSKEDSKQKRKGRRFGGRDGDEDGGRQGEQRITGSSCTPYRGVTPGASNHGSGGLNDAPAKAAHEDVVLVELHRILHLKMEAEDQCRLKRAGNINEEPRALCSGRYFAYAVICGRRATRCHISLESGLETLQFGLNLGDGTRQSHRGKTTLVTGGNDLLRAHFGWDQLETSASGGEQVGGEDSRVLRGLKQWLSRNRGRIIAPWRKEARRVMLCKRPQRQKFAKFKTRANIPPIRGVLSK
ncbi:hypothetical protein B0H16DRAFT_1461620 [Mycena metata]|uniref:Uncharacterized protein n=1 Tax=Mycena metata TaxID=1033252 RepID=A0AAD7IQE1_9AGAR|nr:hypothetical protein B0H16DRAFT_1461620 [Mycena metata]